MLNSKNNITIIDNVTNPLPKGFSFKTLNVSYLDEIHNLLNCHYAEDDNNIVRIIYSKDYLYWYFKYIPYGLIVGLVYGEKLVGMICATIYDIVIDDKTTPVSFINFLCLQKKIRNHGLARYLINELKNRIINHKIKSAIFVTTKKFNTYFTTCKNYAVPINYPKLKKLEFLAEDLPLLERFDNNPLHLMRESDIEIVVPKLNNFLKKFQIRHYLTKENGARYLLPKKNILYSFIAKNNNTITDFVSVHKNYIYCLEKHKMVNVAVLSYYYYETMDLTELIEYLVDKLIDYGFDQLSFGDYADNDQINLTRFFTNNHYHYSQNIDIKNIPCSHIFLPT